MSLADGPGKQKHWEWGETGCIKMGWRCKPALTDNNILSAKVCKVQCSVLFYLIIECGTMATLNDHHIGDRTEVVYDGDLLHFNQALTMWFMLVYV